MAQPTQQALHPRDLGLILSYRCQAACAHCLYNCGPDWHEWMTNEDIGIALRNAKSVWGSDFQVHITGGEPFLNYPLLLNATEQAVHLKIPVYVETNGGWVRNQEIAENRLRELRDAGLGAVLISVSPFHQEAIPLQQTLDGISIARQVFGPDRVTVYQAKWLPELVRHGVKYPVPLSNYFNTLGGHEAGMKLWMGYGLNSGGRAGYRLGKWVPKRPASGFKGENCREELAYANHSHLDLYGNFVPAFCGGVSLGDWHDLSAVVSDFRAGRYSHLIEILLNKGPYGLFLEAKKESGYLEREEGYTGKCHLCVDVRRHLSLAKESVSDLVPHQFYQSI